MHKGFNGIEGDFSRKYIYREYSEGRLPTLLKMIICNVCEKPVASELLPPITYDLFLKFITEGVIQERNGQLTWVTDNSGEAICDSCQDKMEAKDREEGVTLFPPKKFSPF